MKRGGNRKKIRAKNERKGKKLTLLDLPDLDNLQKKHSFSLKDACGYTDGVLDYNQDAHRQR